MLKIQSSTKNYGINFPTYVDEITPEMFKEITKRVNLPKHYCVVALCFKTKIFDFILSMKNKQEYNINVVPVMAKISDEDSKEINSKIGDRLVIDRSSLERGNHINIPIMISSVNAKNYFESDTELISKILRKDASLDIDVTKNIIIMEFKIVPVTDIAASVPTGENPIDPFVVWNNSLS